MKKILSSLIFVLLGVGTTATFAQGTVTFNAYALGEGISQATNATTYGGGTIKITGKTASINRLGQPSWSQSFSESGTSVTGKTAKEGYYKGIFDTYTAGVKVTVEATPNTGYYFDGFTETNSLTPSSWVSRTTPYGEVELPYKGSNYTKNYFAIFKKQSVHRDYAKVVAIFVDQDGVPAFTGDINDPTSIAFTQGGGYVNIGAAATNQTEVTIGNNGIVYRDASEHSWNYVYYATPATDYAFVGWYDETTLFKQLKENSLKLKLDQPTDEEYIKSFTSNCTDASAANIPVAETMYAVFRQSLTYYHSGPKVYVSNNEPEGGYVYVHSTSAGDKPASVAAVAAANWKTSHEDNSTYTQKDNPNYSYTYYAKPSDPEKYAFKGWATSQFSDATYGTDPTQDMYEYTQTMKIENTKEENRYITPSLFAVFESFYYKAPPVALATASLGAGYVYVDLTGSGMPSGYTGTEMVAGALNQKAATGVQYDYSVHYYASAIPGNVFVGWSTTAVGNNIVSQDAHYVAGYNSQAKNRDYPHVAAPLYAVFRSDIDIRQQDRMIVYIDDEGNGNINDSKVLIDFQKANTLTATLTGADKDLFTLSNRSGSKSGSTITFDATQGLIELVVTYKGDLATAVGKVANITLSATYGGQTISRPVTIVVEEAPIVTFLPTDNKGTYTIKMTNGSGINYTMNANTQENIKVAVTHESMSNIEMALTQDVSTDNYYFFGWQMIDGNDMTYLSYEQLCTYQFTKPVSVRAEFIPKNTATYFIKNDATRTLYHDLQKALDDAQVLFAKNSVAQTVVLNDKQGATKITESTLPKGNYTVHAGVTLLIPGDASYTSKTELEPADYDSGKKTAAHYMKWSVEDGTNITVNGNVSIYSRLNANGQTWVGRPWQYGWVELGENCKLTFESGANLYAFGYITGPLTSSVTMKSGSKVKEAFQLLDWHGGTETLNYLKIGLGALAGQLAADEKVFPASQYYIQNVEVPMTLEYGASEYLSAGVDMGDLTVVETPFIATNAGFFRMVDGISLTKHYDKYTDTQVYTVNGNGTAEAKLGNIELEVNVSILTGTLKSEQFVLPMPHNMDIRINNARLNVLYDLAFLAGSKVSVDKNSRFIVNGTSSQSARVFIYDRSENGPHYSLGKKELVPVGARPGGILYERTPEYLEDASWVVDGVVETGQYGYLYTTASGANITSNGGGKMKYAKIGTETKTYQRTLEAGFIPIPVTAAKMRNSDGTYVNSDATTFTYKQGQWMKEDSEGTYKEPILVDYTPKFNVENKTLTAYVGKSDTQTLGISTNNNNLNWSDDVTWSYVLTGTNADRFTVTGTLPNANVVFTPRSEGTKTATLYITAKYEHTIHNQDLTYVYTKAVYLTGNASYLKENTLAFADWGHLYEGMTTPVTLFEGGSMNNTKDIIVTKSANILDVQGTGESTTILPTNKGTVTITATQAADLTNNIAGTTITKTVTVTDPVIWNWGDLYFGTVNENPVTILNGATEWTLVETQDKSNIINLQGTSPNYTVTIVDQIAGKYDAKFEYKDNKGITKPFTSTIYTNPRHLRVDVNNDTVFRAVTLSANNQVEYHETSKSVQFTSTDNTISQWKMTYIGVPDKVYFTPTGENTWQIEESDNGVNWTTSMPWKYLTQNVAFEMSLLPTTKYVRISYGAGSSYTGRLYDYYITELADVKANVDKLYMPVESNGAGGYLSATKDIALTYANVGQLSITTSNTTDFKLKLADSGDEPTDAFNLPATTEENPYGLANVEVISNAQTEQLAYLYVYQGKNLLLQIPIQTYFFPQELPIKLATDKPDGGDRFYYVTTQTHNVEWDGTNGVRTITLDNAVSDAAPYMIFAFDGNPTYISFDYTPSEHNNTTWEIEEYTPDISGNYEWKAVAHGAYSDGDILGEVAGSSLHRLKRNVSPSADKLRVIYQSAYAEKIQVTDLVIVGNASVVVDPTKLDLDYNVAEQVTLTAINLTALDITTSSSNFTITPTTTNAYNQTLSLNTTTNPEQLGESKMGDIVLDVKWTGDKMVEYGSIVITNPNDDNAVLATVELVGVKNTLTNGTLNINTGVAEGYTLQGTFDEKGAELRPVDISASFSTTGKPLFDYVVIYGETTTDDGSKIITTPTKTAGSNAKTPCYIYKSNGTNYVLYTEKLAENANSKDKVWADAVTIPSGKNAVSMYITGFCPYASTGYSKDQEGVWYFRAKGGQSIDVYLEDCFIYSRAKTIDGHTFADRSDGQSFVDSYVRGSGAVLVFMCEDKKDNNNSPMNVTIYTLDNNLLKSNYGCFLQSVAGRAFQASSPVQIRIKDDTYYNGVTPTILNFTDEWGASQNSKTNERTNGFVSLQKQVNNAPSIDMGAPNTVVNFNGGQVELQNAQIVSHNYKSSLAICPRSGKFAEFRLAYGMGTDDVSGTVNFNDGTTTVLPMWVSPDYFESYLCDKDEHGNFITNAKGEYLTTCLRTPTNTYVYGGSHCMMRACKDPSSQGGAPKDGPEGQLLGIYKYPKNPESGKKGGWDDNGVNGLVTPTTGNVPDGYKVASVTPNTNGTDDVTDDYLNFWFDPEFEPTAQPEVDKTISYWKTCMTQIGAEYAAQSLEVGGETSVGVDEVVKNLLYCKIDENILNVINGDNFMAPVKNPAPSGDGYIPIHPNIVGEETEKYITNADSYQVENKVYYITTATADVWNAFTAPFNVANIYVMETYPEDELDRMEWDKKHPGYPKTRSQLLEIQAEQNAYFAAFFAVTIALKQNKNFDQMYSEYMEWANEQDKTLDSWNGTPLRGMRKLIPYTGANWATADFYLNENTADWVIEDEENGQFTTSWAIPDASDGILMEQGKTYSMLLPYCTGCVDYDANGDPIARDYWDYWTGKFIIFESTDGSVYGPHTITGTDDYWNNLSIIEEAENGIAEGTAKLLGNTTFDKLDMSSSYDVLAYSADIKHSTFFTETDFEVQPTVSFMMANISTPAGVSVRSVSREGKITYSANPQGPTTGTHTPTVGGGNDMFITAIDGGINVAVAAPQNIYVVNATGHIIYSGYVSTNVNVLLPMDGIYVVKGENEVQKILF